MNARERAGSAIAIGFFAALGTAMIVGGLSEIRPSIHPDIVLCCMLTALVVGGFVGWVSPEWWNSIE